MKGLANWFSGKANEEEKAKINFMLDPTKPLKKRFAILLQITKAIEKSSPNTGYNEKLHEFFKVYAEPATHICLSLLRNVDGPKNKAKSAS